MDFNKPIKNLMILWLPGWMGALLFINAIIFLASANHDVLYLFFPLFIAVVVVSVFWLAIYIIFLIFKREKAEKGMLFSAIIGGVSLWPSMGIVATHMY